MLVALDRRNQRLCEESSGNGIGCSVAAVREGRFKLVRGKAGRGDWYVIVSLFVSLLSLFALNY